MLSGSQLIERYFAVEARCKQAASSTAPDEFHRQMMRKDFFPHVNANNADGRRSTTENDEQLLFATAAVRPCTRSLIEDGVRGRYGLLPAARSLPSRARRKSSHRPPQSTSGLCKPN